MAPLVRILNDSFRIVQGKLLTVHAVTKSQNLLPGTNTDRRLMYPASGGIVLYKSGSSEMLREIFPHLADRFSFETSTFRVDVPTGSVLELDVQVEKPVNLDRVKKLFRDVADAGIYGMIVKVLRENTVEDVPTSAYCIGDPYSALVVESKTEVNGDRVKIVAYYDNEFAYAQRVSDLAREFARRG